MDVAGQIEMLSRQREKIDGKDFDLEAWKSTTAILFINIFGQRDPRIKTIESLKIDYGSWALRDASSKYDPVATCKRKARDLVDLSVEELRTLEDENQPMILEVLKGQLTGNQMKEINAILAQKDKKRMKSDLAKKLQILKAPLLSQILADILLNANA